MIIKTKCLFLKDGIDPQELEKYGFHTSNNGLSYWLNVDCFDEIGWYHDTRRFVYKYPKNGKYKKVIKYIPKDMLDLVEIRYFYEWVAIFGRWENYSQEKIDKIKKRLEELENENNNN